MITRITIEAEGSDEAVLAAELRDEAAAIMRRNGTFGVIGDEQYEPSYRGDPRYAILGTLTIHRIAS